MSVLILVSISADFVSPLLGSVFGGTAGDLNFLISSSMVSQFSSNFFPSEGFHHVENMFFIVKLLHMSVR